MFTEKRACLLAVEFSELEVFIRMLNIKHKRVKLFKSFQGLINHGSNVPDELIQDFSRYLQKEPLKAINVGIQVGSFFNEGGWYDYSIKILTITEELCMKQKQTVEILKKCLECYHK